MLAAGATALAGFLGQAPAKAADPQLAPPEPASEPESTYLVSSRRVEVYTTAEGFNFVYVPWKDKNGRQSMQRRLLTSISTRYSARGYFVETHLGLREIASDLHARKMLWQHFNSGRNYNQMPAYLNACRDWNIG